MSLHKQLKITYTFTIQRGASLDFIVWRLWNITPLLRREKFHPAAQQSGIHSNKFLFFSLSTWQGVLQKASPCYIFLFKHFLSAGNWQSLSCRSEFPLVKGQILTIWSSTGIYKWLTSAWKTEQPQLPPSRCLQTETAPLQRPTLETS